MSTLAWLKPAGRRPEKPSRAPPENVGGRAIAGKPFDLVVARLADGEGEQADPSLLGDGGALLRRPFSALPLPLGDLSSSILGAPTARR